MAAQAVPVENGGDVGRRYPFVEREIDVERHEVVHLSCPVDDLQHAHGRAVCIGGVPVDELSEQPQTGAEFIP